MGKKHKIRKGKKIGKLRALVYVIGVILMTVVLKFAVLLLLIGMLPAFVARYVDSSDDCNNSRVISYCNLAGVLPFIAELFKKGISSEAVSNTMLTPHVWLVMYGAAAFGWALVWFFPQAVYFVLDIAQNSTIAKLNTRQQQIVDEWGLEVEKTSRRALRNAAFREEHKVRGKKPEE